jgi:hypothetical protein
VTRKVLAVIAGIVGSALVITLIEAMAFVLFPPGPLDPRSGVPVNPPPVGLMLCVLVAWAAGAVAGGWTATKIARAAHGPALAVGSLQTGACIVNMIAIPSPWWFWVLGLAVSIPLALVGWWMARRP